jgi:hypothetical protein
MSVRESVASNIVTTLQAATTPVTPVCDTRTI